MKKVPFLFFITFGILLTSAYPPITNLMLNKEWRIISVKNKGTSNVDSIAKLDYSLFFEDKSITIFMDENECSVEYQIEPENRVSIFAGHNCKIEGELSKMDKYLIKSFLEIKHYQINKDSLFLETNEAEMFLKEVPKSTF